MRFRVVGTGLPKRSWCGAGGGCGACGGSNDDDDRRRLDKKGRLGLLVGGELLFSATSISDGADDDDDDDRSFSTSRRSASSFAWSPSSFPPSQAWDKLRVFGVGESDNEKRSLNFSNSVSLKEVLTLCVEASSGRGLPRRCWFGVEGGGGGSDDDEKRLLDKKGRLGVGEFSRLLFPRTSTVERGGMWPTA